MNGIKQDMLSRDYSRQYCASCRAPLVLFSDRQ